MSRGRKSDDRECAAQNPRGSLRQYERCVRIGALDDPRLRESKASVAWDVFRKDAELKRKHGITEGEIKMLSQASLMGEARSPADFLFLLKVLRSAVNR